ncbi:MAG: MFS transporter [Endomicrobium sp.]|nr:MFS transporter [Endomicrobium sp.]
MEKIKVGNYRWFICSLLFIMAMLNYLDRQTLSLLHPFLADKYNWTNNDYANITGTFQLTYAVMYLFAGRFADWFGARKTLILAAILCSAATIMHIFSIYIGNGLSHLFEFAGITISFSVIGFMFSRFLLAAGSAPIFPTDLKIVSLWFPDKERSSATGIYISGASAGAIIAPLIIPPLAQRFGWESAFIVAGVGGLLWLFFWIAYYNNPDILLKKNRIKQIEYDYINEDKSEEEYNTKSNEKKIGWSALLQCRQTWALIVGRFMTDGIWWFFIFWLPGYLKATYGMQGKEVMFPLAVLFTMTTIGTLIGGYIPSIFIKKGMDIYISRMRSLFIFAFIPAIAFLAQPLSPISYWLPILIIGISLAGQQAWSANVVVVMTDMFPKKAVASLGGIGGLAAGMGGIILAKTAGYLLDYYGALGKTADAYTIIFSFCASSCIVSWFIMKALVPKFKFAFEN